MVARLYPCCCVPATSVIPLSHLIPIHITGASTSSKADLGRLKSRLYRFGGPLPRLTRGGFNPLWFLLFLLVPAPEESAKLGIE